MAIRSARIDDLAAIIEIYNEAVLTTTATADYEPQSYSVRFDWYQSRTQAGYPVLVYEQDGEVLGFGALGPYVSRPGYRFTAENSIYVAHRAHGQGIGKALLAAILDSAREMGLRNILASISSDNVASLRLHEAFGFVEVGRCPALVWKFGQWIDVLLLQCVLDPDLTPDA